MAYLGIRSSQERSYYGVNGKDRPSYRLPADKPKKKIVITPGPQSFDIPQTTASGNPLLNLFSTVGGFMEKTNVVQAGKFFGDITAGFFQRQAENILRAPISFNKLLRGEDLTEEERRSQEELFIDIGTSTFAPTVIGRIAATGGKRLAQEAVVTLQDAIEGGLKRSLTKQELSTLNKRMSTIRKLTVKEEQEAALKFTLDEFAEKGVKKEATEKLSQEAASFKTAKEFADDIRIQRKALDPKVAKKQIDELNLKIKEVKQLPEEVFARKAIAQIVETQRTAQQAIDKLSEALKGARTTAKEQAELTTKQRATRATRAEKVTEGLEGEAKFRAEKAQLTGEFEKVDFAPLKLEQAEKDALFNMIDTTELTFFEKVTAKSGLGKILGEGGGRIPVKSELKQLRRVFPQNVVQDVIEQISVLTKAKNLAVNVGNVPRSLMSSFDLSGSFRQGIFFIGRKEFWKSFNTMFKSFKSENAFEAVGSYIKSLPHAHLHDDAGLAITDIGRELSVREEKFMSTLAEKIPAIGPVVRASNRAYTSFLNKLRADVFEDFITKGIKAGHDMENDITLLKEVGKFINAGTGRGNLPKSLERSADVLNTMFFSPRLMSSRLTLLNPATYITTPPLVRKEALKSLLSFGGIAGTMLGLAALSGAEVETDARSTDFAKIKIGKTRIDLLGGFQQYMRMFTQFFTGEIKKNDGEILKLGDSFINPTRYDVVLRGIESKEAPIFSFITALMKGKNFKGEDIRVGQEVGERFIPMVIQDMFDLAQEEPELLPLSILAIFGIGLQTYESKKSKNEGVLPKLPSLRGAGLPKLPKLSL